MKAEETVMDYDLKLCHSLIGKFSLSAIKDVVDEECLAQAEISFKAGIQEVVDWQCSHRVIGFYFDTDSEKEEQELRLAWSMQLKEWGL